MNKYKLFLIFIPIIFILGCSSESKKDEIEILAGPKNYIDLTNSTEREAFEVLIKKSIREENLMELDKLIKYTKRIHLNDFRIQNSPLINYTLNNHKYNSAEYLINSKIDIFLTDDKNETALYAAAKSKNHSLISLILKKGGNPNRIIDGESLLFKAIKSHNRDLVQTLISYGSKVNMEIDGFSPIHKAVLNKNVDIVNTLIKNGADVNRPNVYEEYPIHIAIREESIEIVKALIKSGADINIENKYDETPFVMSIKKKSPEIFKLLLVNGVSTKNKYKGLRIIELSAISGFIPGIKYAESLGQRITFKTEIGKSLLNKIHDPETLSYVLNNTKWNRSFSFDRKLLINKMYNDVNLAKILIKKKIDINTKDEKGWTPLHIALSNDNLDLVKLLVENGADVNATNNENIPVIVTAISTKNAFEITKYLITKGVNLKVKYSHGIPILFSAVQEGKLDLLVYLIDDIGLSIKELDNQKSNILMYLPNNKYKNILLYLLEKGANINHINNNGFTLLHFALEEQNLEKIRFLVEHGADPYKTFCPYGSAYDYARINNLKDDIEYFDSIKRREILHFVKMYKKFPTIKAQRFIKKGDVIVDQITGLMWADSDNKSRTSWGEAKSYCNKLRNGGYKDWRVPNIKEMKTIFNTDSNNEIVSLIKLSRCNFCLHWSSDEINNRAAKFEFKTGEIIWRSKKEKSNRVLPVRGVMKKNDVTELLFNRYDVYGVNFLHWAAARGEIEMIKLLIDKGISVHSKDIYGNTPLHIAAKWGELDAVKILFEKGSDLNIKNNYLKTPLFLSGENARIDVVKFLVSKGGKVKVIDRDKNTMIHKLIEKHNQFNKRDVENTIKYLISIGVGLNIKNRLRKTPIQLANIYKADYLIELLEEQIIDISNY